MAICDHRALNELVLLALDEGRARDLPRFGHIANVLVLAALAPAP